MNCINCHYISKMRLPYIGLSLHSGNKFHLGMRCAVLFRSFKLSVFFFLVGAIFFRYLYQ